MKTRNLAVWTLTTVLSLALAVGCSKFQNQSAGNRPDTQVASDVQGKINGDNNLPNKQITVNANNGVVTLSGNVGSDTERMTAGNDAAQVDGVKTVVNNLQTGSAMAMPGPVNAAPAQQQPMARSSVHQSSRVRSSNRGVAPAPFPSNSDSTSTARSSDYSAPVRPAAPPPPVTITVPAGTTFSVRVIDTIDTSKTQTGEQFSATLDSPVYVDDRIVIPSGADVRGRVVSSKSAGKFEGQSDLALDLINVSYGGHSYGIKTDKWEKAGAGRGKNTAAKVGGGAALGAIIGGLAGGGRGAAIGATAGAGAGAGAQAITHGQQVVVKPETLLTFTLASPVTIMPSGSSENPNRRRLPVPDNNNTNQ